MSIFTNIAAHDAQYESSRAERDPLRSRSPLLRQLDREWERRHRSPRAIAEVRSWVTGDPGDPVDALFRSVTDLEEIVAATQRGQRRGDAILARLVRLTPHHELAGRIVVQRLLPGLIRSAMPFLRFHPDADLMELAVPATWIAICSYDVERRDRHIAPSLISDATFQAFRSQLRRRSFGEVTRPGATFAELPSRETEPTDLEMMASVLRDARAAGVADHHVELLADLARGETPMMIAARCKVSCRMIRYRRTEALGHIRAAVAA